MRIGSSCPGCRLVREPRPGAEHGRLAGRLVTDDDVIAGFRLEVAELFRR